MLIRPWPEKDADARFVRGQRVLRAVRTGRRPVSRVSFVPCRNRMPASEFAADAAAVMPANASLTRLLSSHILRDGEVVLLILRPSLWFVVLSCVQFLAVALAFTFSIRFMNIPSHATVRSLTEFGVSAISARLAWATLQWVSRLYVLTDMRVISLSGVFQMQIFECPLRKVVRTHLTRNAGERLTGTGSIEIIPQHESSPFGEWTTIARPIQVHEKILAAITRAKQGGEPA